MKKNGKKEKGQNGSVTRYIYSAAGEKLRVTYLTAVPNITVPIGGTRELSPSEILSADSTDYLLGGTLTMRNGRIDRYLFDEGYCQAAKYASIPVQDTFTFYYFDRDHLGSVRQVVKADRNTNGTVVQRMEYYPSGLQFCNNTTDSDKQPRRYNGKEYDKMHGLCTYDYGARQYNPVTARWDRVDPLCEKFYGISPYAYCNNNPVKYIDPDGLSTWVTDEGDGKYKVIGGNLYDKDYNIYVYYKDKNGENTIRGKSIGKTPLISSFYNSDANKGKGGWAKGSIIDINDMSGINFIQDVKGNDVSLLSYIANAFNDHKYDFKATNGTDAKIYDVKDYYRGMPIKMENGEILYTSARDIGNMMAGYKAGVSGLNWSDVEKAFDLYQSIKSQKITKEGFSTRNAEMYGFMIGHHKLPNRGKDKILNFITLIGSL